MQPEGALTRSRLQNLWGPASGSDSLPPARAWPQFYGGEQCGNRRKGKSRRKIWAERKNARHGPGVLSSRRFGDQLNRLETDFSSAVRLIASPISGAIEIARMLAAAVMAAVGSMELVITSSFSLEEVTRATAPKPSKSHKCSRCGKTYARSADLQHQLDTAHAETLPQFRCPLCDRPFRKQKQMLVHLRNRRCFSTRGRPWANGCAPPTTGGE